MIIFLVNPINVKEYKTFIQMITIIVIFCMVLCKWVCVVGVWVCVVTSGLGNVTFFSFYLSNNLDIKMKVCASSPKYWSMFPSTGTNMDLFLLQKVASMDSARTFWIEVQGFANYFRIVI